MLFHPEDMPFDEKKITLYETDNFNNWIQHNIYYVIMYKLTHGMSQYLRELMIRYIFNRNSQKLVLPNNNIILKKYFFFIIK